MWILSKTSLRKIFLLFCVGCIAKAFREQLRYYSNDKFIKKRFFSELEAEVSKKADSWREAEKLCQQKSLTARLVQLRTLQEKRYVIAQLREKLPNIARKRVYR